MQIGDVYDINGLMMLKNGDGISVSGSAVESNDIIYKKEYAGELEDFKKVPTARHFLDKEAYSYDEKIGNAMGKIERLNAVWPVEIKDKVVTSCYGDRIGDRIKLCGKGHCGIDIRVKDQNSIADVIAISSGNVVKVNEGMGEVLLDHGNGMMSIYIHMSRIDVDNGDSVRRGQKIGRAGNKGNEDRDGQEHLHFGILIDGVYYDPLEIGIFNAKELLFAGGSNCFSNKYNYELGAKI